SPDLAPGGRGATHAMYAAAWPFEDKGTEVLWVTLRAGPEIIGCLTVDTSAQAQGAGEDDPALIVFADLLAMYVQTMRLRSERDIRVEELDASIRRLTIEQNWLRVSSTSLTGCRTLAEVVDLTYEAVRHGLGFD